MVREPFRVIHKLTTSGFGDCEDALHHRAIPPVTVRFMRAVRPERLQGPFLVIRSSRSRPFNSLSHSLSLSGRPRSRRVHGTAGRNVRIRTERKAGTLTDGWTLDVPLEWPHRVAPGSFSGISALSVASAAACTAVDDPEIAG